MSDLQDVIVTTTVRAFNSGVAHERQRIVKMLEPLAECDKEMCGTDGETHYGLDCDAYTYHHVIQQILKAESEENQK
jgi:hypothetical protein